MRVLVTGAAGFIGSSICERLVKNGHNVLGVDSFSSYYDPAIKRRNVSTLQSVRQFEMREADLRSADLDELLADVEVVFHEAGQPGVRGSWGPDFVEYLEANVFATQRLLEAVRRTTNIRAFVAASSSSVYGNSTEPTMSEWSVPRPISPYGVSKLASEHLCTVYGEQFRLPVVSLRYFTVFGPRQRPDMAISRLIEAARTHSTFFLNGTGTQLRDFTYIDDVVDANLCAMDYVLNHGINHRVFNIGSGSPVTISDLVSLVSSLSGLPVKVEKLQGAIGDPRSTFANSALAHSELKWSPKTSLRQGLHEALMSSGVSIKK